MYKEESAQSNQGAQGRTHGNILSIRKVNIDKNTLGVDSKKGGIRGVVQSSYTTSKCIKLD